MVQRPPIPEARKRQRMRQDADMIANPDRWPGNVLHVKTQPWVDERAHGFIRADNPTLVHSKDAGGMNEAFSTIADLVDRWSVD